MLKKRLTLVSLNQLSTPVVSLCHVINLSSALELWPCFGGSARAHSSSSGSEPLYRMAPPLNHLQTGQLSCSFHPKGQTCSILFINSVETPTWPSCRDSVSFL